MATSDGRDHARAASGSAAGASHSQARPRIIIALDLDAFYVAASRKRDPSLNGLPVGIKQKHILATASYEARARGVRKLALIKDAVRQCPELVLVNGEDLSFFRNVSADVFRVVSSVVAGAPVEKLGMDELFVDVSELIAQAQERLAREGKDAIPWLAACENADPAAVPHGVVLPVTTDSVLSDRRSSFGLDAQARSLLLASHLARYIRTRVEEQVGLTSSAGIAESKLLAKLVGNTHKPNRQTVLAPLGHEATVHDDTQQFLDPFPLRSLNGFGSAIVAKMCTYAIKALGAPDDAFDNKQLTVSLANQIFDHPTLVTLFQLRLATRLYELLHARDDEPVVAAPEYPAQISIEDTYQGLPFARASEQFSILSESLLRRLEHEIVTYDTAQTHKADAEYSLVIQGYDAIGDPLPPSADVNTAPMRVRDYEEKAEVVRQGRYQWRRYPLTMRLSIRQGYTNRISRQARMPVEIFDLAKLSRKERASALASSAQNLFRAMIAAEGDRGEGLNLINIAALDLSPHRPASSISGFFASTSLTSDGAQATPSSLPRGIDLSFLRELPADLRAEIAAEYGVSLEDLDASTVSEQPDNVIAQTPSLTCNICGESMSPWLQHDHVRWPGAGLSYTHRQRQDQEDEQVLTQDNMYSMTLIASDDEDELPT